MDRGHISLDSNEEAQSGIYCTGAYTTEAAEHGHYCNLLGIAGN